MRINHNISALNAWRALGQTDNAMTKSLERLSSGLRINRAADDAAGLAISEKMRGQIRGLNQAIRNAQDAISLIQTAEGALNETHAILQRMRELAVQAASDTNTDDDRLEIQKEMDQLATELTRIAETTEFNTKALLDGSFNGTFHIGANKGQSNSLSIAAMDASSLNVGTEGTVLTASATLEGVTFTAKEEGEAGNGIQIVFEDPETDEAELSISVSGNIITVSLATDDSGAITSTAVDIADAINNDTDASALVTATGTGTDAVSTGSATLAGGADSGGISGIDVTSQTAANDAIDIIQNALNTVSSQRSELGAVQNRLEHTIANLGVAAENLTAAESRIRDVDMAQEMMEFTKNQILIQAGTAMLANANVRPQSVLQLLG